MSVIEELRAKAAKKKAGQVQPVIDTTAVEKPVEPEPAAEGPQPPDEPPPETRAPRKRGRPAGSKNKLKPVEEPAPEQTETAAAEPSSDEPITEGLSVRSILKALRLLRGHAKALGLVLSYQLGTSDYVDDQEDG